MMQHVGQLANSNQMGINRNKSQKKENIIHHVHFWHPWLYDNDCVKVFLRASTFMFNEKQTISLYVGFSKIKSMQCQLFLQYQIIFLQ